MEKTAHFTAIFHHIAMHFTELSHVSPTRPERAEAPSPGHRPGLGASALSGRAASGVCGPSARCLNHMRKFSILHFLNWKVMSC